jgi:hypothetical protein
MRCRRGGCPARRRSTASRSVRIALADRLDDLDRPVSAAGMRAVRRLLTEPDGVLYARPLPDEPSRDIARELGAVLDRLEVRP